MAAIWEFSKYLMLCFAFLVNAYLIWVYTEIHPMASQSHQLT